MVCIEIMWFASIQSNKLLGDGRLLLCYLMLLLEGCGLLLKIKLKDYGLTTLPSLEKKMEMSIYCTKIL